MNLGVVENVQQSKNDNNNDNNKCQYYYSVIIIGAGAAGLQCANRLLSEHHQTLSILEGRDRIGGRIHTNIIQQQQHNNNNSSTNNVKEFAVDYGAAWVHGTGLYEEPLARPETDTDSSQPMTQRNPMMELLRRLQTTPTTQQQLPSQTTWNEPLQLFFNHILDGNIWTRPQTVGHDTEKLVLWQSGTNVPSTMVREALQRHFQRMKRVSNYGQYLYHSQRGMETTSTSVQQVLDEIRNEEEEVPCDPRVDRVSGFYLHLLECWNGSSLNHLQLSEFVEDETTIEGDQEYKPQGDFCGPHGTLKNGMQTILQPLLQNGVSERVLLQEEVVDITYADHKMILTTRTGKVFRCEVCVCTVPVGCLKRHLEDGVFFPSCLSEAKKEAIRRTSMGHYRKVLLTFDEIFWSVTSPCIGLVRDHSVDELGTYLILDNLWVKDDIPCIEAVLCGSVGERTTGLSDERVKNLVLQFMAEALDFCLEEISSRCVDYHVTRWEEDPFSYGAYSHQPLGRLERHAEELRRPECDGRLIFAGEATVSEYEGSVHAALLSGSQAADLAMTILCNEACPK